MNLRNTVGVGGQMAYSLCFFRYPPPWIAVLVPFLICYGFLGYGLLLPIFLTSLVLILSTVRFTFSRPKPLLVKKSVRDEAVTPVQECLPQVEEVVSVVELKREEEDTITQRKEAPESEVGQIHDQLVKSPVDSFWESESINGHSSTTEDSEVEWPYSGNVGQIQDCSDGSISDEESLIEIRLPSGHYVDYPKEEEEEEAEEDPKCKSEVEYPMLWPAESLSRQHSLMELFSEMNDMNEEENLIEIDISMGSIKCSRFEIEA